MIWSFEHSSGSTGSFLSLKVRKNMFVRHPGNAAKYDLAQIRELKESPLREKNILFLGSSVTYGAASMGVSFVDDIAAKDGCRIVKEAVSGTTLVDADESSYVSRLKKVLAGQIDLFVCQLSTNDATKNKPLGKVSTSWEKESFDTATVAGAIEYILAYVKEKWNCPMAFYTNPRYDSAVYGEMVTLLLKLAKKWEISVLDLWDDVSFNQITEEERKLYMADAIHPTKAGYLIWWMPKIEEFLYREME